MKLKTNDWIELLTAAVIAIILYMSFGLKELIIYVLFVALALKMGHFFKEKMMPAFILAGTFVLLFVVDMIWPKFMTNIEAGHIFIAIMLFALVIYLIIAALVLKTGGAFKLKKKK